MKTAALLATSLLALSFAAQAAPTEINYQGVLTDQNGNPVNGVRAMQIKIYDAPTGGTLLYSEDLGNVPVQDGIYSFSFGANGTSNALTTETVAIANGTVSTFQKVLAAPTVVAGSLTVTDGTYTWDQTNGSSNENDFSVAYSPNLRRVTVTYYNGAPAAGKTINAKFRSPGSGITGALAEDNQPWIEVSLAGVSQAPRQKVLSIPFANISNYAYNISDNALKKITDVIAQSSGQVISQITDRSNSIESYIGLAASESSVKSSDPNYKHNINLNSTLVSQVVLSLHTLYQNFQRKGYVLFNYADGSSQDVSWSKQPGESSEQIILNPNPNKLVKSIVENSQEYSPTYTSWFDLGCYIDVYSTSKASLTFSAADLKAAQLYISGPIEVNELLSPQIIIVDNNGNSFGGPINSWIPIDVTSNVAKIIISGSLKSPKKLKISFLKCLKYY